MAQPLTAAITGLLSRQMCISFSILRVSFVHQRRVYSPISMLLGSITLRADSSPDMSDPALNARPAPIVRT